jgi:hypothetical protein
VKGRFNDLTAGQSVTRASSVWTEEEEEEEEERVKRRGATIEDLPLEGRLTANRRVET